MYSPFEESPIKIRRFCVLPPLKNHPSKTYRFLCTPPFEKSSIKIRRFCVLPPLKNHYFWWALISGVGVYFGKYGMSDLFADVFQGIWVVNPPTEKKLPCTLGRHVMNYNTRRNCAMRWILQPSCTIVKREIESTRENWIFSKMLEIFLHRCVIKCNR